MVLHTRVVYSGVFSVEMFVRCISEHVCDVEISRRAAEKQFTEGFD